jgi:outer membrane protein assembly factor BamB
MNKFLSALGLISVAAGAGHAAAPASTAHRAAPARSAAIPPGGFKLPRPTVKPGLARPDGLMPREYLPTSQIHAGMSGYGLTVFHGNQIERFDVRILGLMRKMNNGRDLILVKLGGPNMSRVSDIIAGMSGSPVYINGRLIGAVSMGFQFTKEPIGMVTPIEDMLDAWDPALPQTPNFDAPTAARVSLAAPITIEGRRYTHIVFAGPGGAPRPREADTLIARRCLSPILVAGASKRNFTRMAATLRTLGLDAREGPGSTSTPGLKGSALVPGGAIAMSLLTGDIDMTGIGTLTYRRGNRIVAFGHPFLGVGPVDAPMSTAYIHDLLPSYSESEKIGSPVAMVGSFSQDRPFSIGGRIGATPNMAPITVRVTDHMLGRDRLFEAKMVRHPHLTPALATMAAGTAIANVHGMPGDAMATVVTEVVADEVGTIRRTNRVYDPGAIDEAATADLQSLVGLLSSNAFYPVGIRSVKMSVTIDKGRQTAQVDRIFLKQTKYAPGDTIEVGVVLNPYRAPEQIHTLHVKIPASTPAGTLQLTVQGGSGGGAIRMGGFTFVPTGGSDGAPAANLRQLVRKYEERDRNDALVAHLALPTAAVSIDGERLSGLPPNIEAAMRNGTRTSGVRLDRDEVKVSELTDYVLSGAQSLPIRVERPDQPSASPAAPPSGGVIIVAPPAGAAAPPTAAPVSGFGAVSFAPAKIPAAVGRAEIAAPVNAAVPPTGSHAMPSAPGAPATAAVRPTPAPDVPRLVGRPSGLWRQTTADDFRTGKLDGVTVSTTGEIQIAPRLVSVAQTNQPYFWSLAEGPAGTVYAGGGDDGAIYRIDARATGDSAPPAVWAKTGDLEVQSLARGAEGTLYAGTAPGGRIDKIGTNGKPALLFQTPEKYVLALALSPDGRTLYAATGGPTGRVYAVPTAGGPSTTLYEGAEGSVTALTVATNGAVYAGTAPNGLVLQVAGPGIAPGHAVVLYDAQQPSISGLTIGADGALYAVTAPRGILCRVDLAGGATRIVYDKTPNAGPLTGLQTGADGWLYTAAGPTVLAIDPRDGSIRTFDAASDIQILSLLRGSDGRLWIGTGNTAAVYKLDAGTALSEGQFVSGVLDARATAHWGTIRWNGTVPASDALSLETRTGATPQPDATWSDWSRPYAVTVGEPVVSPPGRYLQYRAALRGGIGAAGPVLREVSVYYQTPNQAPQVSLLSPRGGEALRGIKTLRWSGMDPDRDTLSYDLAVSADGGATWKDLKPPAPSLAPATAPAAPQKRPAHAPGAAMITAAPTTNHAAADLAADLARHPEISAEMRARILADAPADATIAVAMPPEPAGEMTETAGDTGDPSRATTYSWDTAALPDGVYRLRVTASDRPSNPSGALTDEKTSAEFRIANHAPSLVLFRHGLTMLADRTVRLEGIALHPSVAIAGVQYRIDGGEWLAAGATDGIFDSPNEPFALTTLPLAIGMHKIEVQAQDEAGNTATQTITVGMK